MATLGTGRTWADAVTSSNGNDMSDDDVSEYNSGDDSDSIGHRYPTQWVKGRTRSDTIDSEMDSSHQSLKVGASIGAVSRSGGEEDGRGEKQDVTYARTEGRGGGGRGGGRVGRDRSGAGTGLGRGSRASRSKALSARGAGSGGGGGGGGGSSFLGKGSNSAPSSAQVSTTDIDTENETRDRDREAMNFDLTNAINEREREASLYVSDRPEKNHLNVKIVGGRMSGRYAGRTRGRRGGSGSGSAYQNEGASIPQEGLYKSREIK